MLLLNITMLIFILNTPVGCLKLSPTTVRDFVIESIVFWKMTKPTVFLNDDFNNAFAKSLWLQLSRHHKQTLPLIYKSFDVDYIRQMIALHHQLGKMIVIGDSAIIWEAFTKILGLKILRYRITIILLCIDCRQPIFDYYSNPDILGQIIFAYPDTESSLVLYAIEYSYQLRGLGVYQAGQWGQRRGFQMEASLSESDFCFRNATLDVLTSETLPYQLDYSDTSCGFPPCGFLGELIKILAQMNNFRMNFTSSNDRHNYGRWVSNKSYTGVVGEFVEKNLDLAIGVFSRTVSREAYLDFTAPFTTGQIAISIHLPSKHGVKPWSFRPASLWLTIGISMLATAVLSILSLLREADHNSKIDWFPITLATWFLQGGIDGPKWRSSRIIYITSCFLFWLLFCFFNGTLISYLTLDSPMTMTTLDQLVQSDYTFGVTTATSSLEWLVTSKDAKLASLHRRAIIRESSISAAEAVCTQPKYAHLAGMATFHSLISQFKGPCSFYYLREIVGKDPYHLITRNDDVLSNRLSRGITRLRSSGIIVRLEKYFMLERRTIITTSAKNRNDKVRLSHLYIQFAFIVGGNCLAIVALVCEIVIYKNRGKNKTKSKRQKYVVEGVKGKRKFLKKTVFKSPSNLIFN